MSENVNLIEMNRLYKLIKELCVVRFFNSAGLECANVFPCINNLCQSLLNEALNNTARFFILDNKNCLKNKVIRESRDVSECEYMGVDEVVDEAISAAYSSFWYSEKEEPDYYKEERYLISHERISLKQWKQGENPYTELQQLSRQYIQEDICDKDIMFILRNIHTLLEQDLSPQDTENSIKDICAYYPNLVEEFLS